MDKQEREDTIDRLADFYAEREMESEAFVFIKNIYLERLEKYSDEELEEDLEEWLE
jgi:hypothetical protein